ncbi:MAG: hypothetical protein WCV67_07905 [Victivallaceae bacterium]|jgi:hypothetical protein
MPSSNPAIFEYSGRGKISGIIPLTAEEQTAFSKPSRNAASNIGNIPTLEKLWEQLNIKIKITVSHSLALIIDFLERIEILKNLRSWGNIKGTE